MIQYDHVRLDVPVWDADGRRATRTLLHDISIELPERRVAFIGANGSGKSTLLRLVNGLAEPTSGRVLVDGLDPAHDGRAVRRRVGFIFSDPASQLVAATPVDDLALGLRHTHRGRAQRRAASLDLLRARGLEQVADQSIHDLSGGERQQVALAGVLATDPAIVVADEPTTMLDLRNRRLVEEELLGLTQQLVFASHDLDFVQRADRALVVDVGRIVFDGEPADAVRHYRDLMEATP